MATIGLVPWEGLNILGWMMGCAFGVSTPEQEVQCRRYVDLHFGIRIAAGLLIWGLLLMAFIRLKRRGE